MAELLGIQFADFLMRPRVTVGVAEGVAHGMPLNIVKELVVVARTCSELIKKAKIAVPQIETEGPSSMRQLHCASGEPRFKLLVQICFVR